MGPIETPGVTLEKYTLHCSFCGKSQHEVRKLIAGPLVFICDECVELCDEIIYEELGPITFYESRFYPFSNFSSFAVEWRGRVWPTSEHAYQAAKFTDESIIRLIFQARSAHDAKNIAHQFADKVRPDWDEIKLAVMEEICRAKLEQHPFIQKRLRETNGRLIVEDSPTDSFWGWGPDRNGHNNLGKIWMKLYSELPPLE